MGFVEEIRDTLRRPPGLAPAPDDLVDACRQIAFTALLEAPAAFGPNSLWTDPGRFHPAIDAAWRAASTGLFGHRPASERGELVMDALGRVLRDGRARTWTLAEQESVRLMELLHPLEPWRDVTRYLVEVGALDPTETRRTAFGDVLLRLPVRELVVGLLHAEACQSTGEDDGYRLPRWVFWRLARGFWTNHDPLDALPPLGRLLALGVVAEDERAGFGAASDRQAWLADAADATSPLGILVSSALDDRAGAAVGGPSSMGAVHDLAELVAHELGNGLSSLELTIGQLAHVLDHRHLERLRGISQRMRMFAASIEHLAPGGEPLTVVGLLDVLNDALRSTTFERNGHLNVSVQVVDAQLRVRRSRVQLALENLVRNAAQAARRAGRVCELRVRAAVAGEGVEIVFEDDGPGVPTDLRDTLFERGVSGRGASGLGLALVREIAGEHRGTVRHEAPEAGGARFVLFLPALGVWSCAGS